jgi:4'-phosphopantetheinyl transferase
VLEPEVRIYHVSAEGYEPGAVLSEQEIARARDFLLEADRHRFAVAHARLRQVLAEHVGGDPAALQFGAGQHGKPFLRGSALEFSLSHSGDIVLIAVAAVPVGADVERIESRDGIDQVAAESFDNAEREWLREQRDRTRAFYRLWTIKEAALKGDGRGISRLKEASVDTQKFDRVVVGADLWSVREVEIDADYCAAVAIRLR